MHRDVVQLWLAVVTASVAIGGLVFGLHGQVHADLREVRDEVRALRDDVQDLGDQVTRLEVRMEAVGPGPDTEPSSGCASEPAAGTV